MTAIIVFLLFLAVQLVASLGALLFSNLDKLGTNFPIDQLTVSPVAAGISLLVAEGLLALGLWLWFYKFEFSVRKKSQNNPELLGIFKFHPLKRDLSTRPIRWYHILFAIVGVLQVAIGLSALLENFQLSDNGSQAIFQEMTHNAFCLLLLCIVGPLCEELVFRVGILRPLYRHRVPAFLAAGISALAFAVVHGNLVQGIPAFIIGFILGLLYLRTGNLWLCLPAHIANNTFAVIFMEHNEVELSTWQSVASLIVGVVIIYGVMVLKTPRTVYSQHA